MKFRLISILAALFSIALNIACTRQESTSETLTGSFHFQPSGAVGSISFQNDIKPIIVSNCSNCHTNSYNAVPAAPSNCLYSWLNLTPGLQGTEGCGLKDIYDRIMDQRVWQCPGELDKPYIDPGYPGNSYLFVKIAAHHDEEMKAKICRGPKGNQAAAMPATALSISDVQKFYDWIYDGAKRN